MSVGLRVPGDLSLGLSAACSPPAPGPRPLAVQGTQTEACSGVGDYQHMRGQVLPGIRTAECPLCASVHMHMCVMFPPVCMCVSCCGNTQAGPLPDGLTAGSGQLSPRHAGPAPGTARPFRSPSASPFAPVLSPR